MKDLKKIGKYMSLLLRHAPEKENLHMNTYGYVMVEQLLKRLNITQEELDYIVETNDKKRFSYNKDKTLIRACQGHTIPVKLELTEVIPPIILYHGTTKSILHLIKEDGLKRMLRQYVHLTDDLETAKKVGLRHCKNNIKNLVIFEIDTELMLNDGIIFYLSDNGVYLTESVPTKYLTYKK